LRSDQSNPQSDRHGDGRGAKIAIAGKTVGEVERIPIAAASISIGGKTVDATEGAGVEEDDGGWSRWLHYSPDRRVAEAERQPAEVI
jgi:hypothetical protein